MGRIFVAFMVGAFCAELWDLAGVALRRVRRRFRNWRAAAEYRKRQHRWQCDRCAKLIIGFAPDQHAAHCEARDIAPYGVHAPGALWFCWCGHAGQGATDGHFTDACRAKARNEPGSAEDIGERRLSPREVCDFAAELKARLDKHNPPDWEFWKPEAKESPDAH